MKSKELFELEFCEMFDYLMKMRKNAEEITFFFEMREKYRVENLIKKSKKA